MSLRALLLLIAPLLTGAQKPSMIVGPVIQSRGSEFLIRSNSDDMGVCYIRPLATYFRGPASLYGISGHDGGVVFEKTIAIPRDAEFHSFISIKEKLLLFFYRRHQRTYYLLVQEFSRINGEAHGEPLVIDQYPAKERKTRKHAFEFSPDRSKMLVIIRSSRKRHHDLRATLYDAGSYKQIWEKRPMNLYGQSGAYCSNFRVDDQGTLAFLFAYYKDLKTEEVSFGIGVIPPNNFQSMAQPIPSDGRSILTPHLEFSNGRLLCTGEFLKGSNATKYANSGEGFGFFAVIADPATAQVISHDFPQLPLSASRKLTYKDDSRFYELAHINSQAASNKIYTDFARFWKNGCLWVVRIHAFTIVSDSRLERFHREIIVQKFGTDLKQEWVTVIPRYSTREAGGMAIFPGEKLRVLCYDDPANSSNRGATYDARLYKLVRQPGLDKLIMHTVDESGNITSASFSGGAAPLFETRIDPGVPEDEGPVVLRVAGDSLRFAVIKPE